MKKKINQLLAFLKKKEIVGKIKLILALVLAVVYNALLLGIFLTMLFEVSTDSRTGYAGDTANLSDGFVVRPLYFSPADAYRVGNVPVSYAGDMIDNSIRNWTTLGYKPEKFDQVIVNEVRLWWRPGFNLIHGWGYVQFIGRASPFHIGQRVVPTKETLARHVGLNDEFSKGGEVINFSDDNILVKYDNGEIEGYPWELFEPADYSHADTGWAIGNNFYVGQVICSTSEAKKLINTPDQVVVTDAYGPYVRISGSDHDYNYIWFQDCP